MFPGASMGGCTLGCSPSSGFLKKTSACGEELNGPSADDDVLAFHLAPELFEVIEYRGGRNNETFLLRFESNEHINIERTDRL